MKKALTIILSALAMMCAVSAEALDLPVKTVNGRQYYYYRAENGESVHGISKKLGLTREQIVHYNPGVADGVRRGAILYFPVEDFAAVEPEPSPEHVLPAVGGVAVQEADMNVTVPEIVMGIGTAVDTFGVRSARALVALPFGLDGDGEDRQNRHALDFYKGFLIAADTLAGRSGNVEIRAMDFVGPHTVPDTALTAVQVAVFPDNAGLVAMAERCAAVRTYVFNLFSVRDTTYRSNPYMIQANIPAEIMYRKAADGLLDAYGDYTPVIIRNISGRNEKDPFTEYLAARCDSAGRRCLRIEYTGNLSTADLAPLEASPETDFVIVPSSGTLAEFNKFAYVLRNFRDSRMAGADESVADDAGILPAVTAEADSIVPATQRIALFGYPDWMAFRSDAEELLYAMEATVYSRFYDDYDSFASRNIDSDFLRWYGEPMLESVPSQGLLGYDAGSFIIRNMRINGGVFRPDRSGDYRGVQSTFRLERVPGGGFVNTALYIVQFHPYGRMSAKVL